MDHILPFFFFCVVLIGCKSRSACIDEEVRAQNKDRMCIMVYEPVCGCDGRTYGNSCEAGRNGVVEFTKGECK